LTLAFIAIRANDGYQPRFFGSAVGASIFAVEFNFDLNLDTAEEQIRRPIEPISNSHLADTPRRPIVAQVGLTDPPSLNLAPNSETKLLAGDQAIVECRCR